MFEAVAGRLEAIAIMLESLLGWRPLKLLHSKFATLICKITPRWAPQLRHPVLSVFSGLGSCFPGTQWFAGVKNRRRHLHRCANLRRRPEFDMSMFFVIAHLKYIHTILEHEEVDVSKELAGICWVRI